MSRVEHEFDVYYCSGTFDIDAQAIWDGLSEERNVRSIIQKVAKDFEIPEFDKASDEQQAVMALCYTIGQHDLTPKNVSFLMGGLLHLFALST